MDTEVPSLGRPGGVGTCRTIGGMTKQHAISVRGLRKRYRGITAVDGVDLEIEFGEVFAVLGPNGAGKTTTVEILEGYRPRDGGEVSVLDTDPAHATREWRQQVGIVLQDAADAGELTVLETVAHFARYYPAARDPSDVIAMVGLEEHARRRVRVLSGGQRRRLDVAIGVVGRPRLLFLDEPTTGFDPQARRQFWELVRGLASDGTTILLTTHYLEEAEALADRVAVLAHGRIVAEGPPDSIGGRNAALSTVSWLDGADRQEMQTDNPASAIADLTHRFGGSVPGLIVTQPSLEDVYLNLIGSQS
jgi:ABC-2 type transport system ATP-binding protein